MTEPPNRALERILVGLIDAAHADDEHQAFALCAGDVEFRVAEPPEDATLLTGLESLSRHAAELRARWHECEWHVERVSLEGDRALMTVTVSGDAGDPRGRMWTGVIALRDGEIADVEVFADPHRALGSVRDAG